MCKYCEENLFKMPESIYQHGDANLYVYRGELIFEDIIEEYATNFNIEINYCPMCGEKL